VWLVDGAIGNPGRTAATPPPWPIETELGQRERGARFHGRRREIVECATAQLLAISTIGSPDARRSSASRF
jgi:hypothetical protein